MNFDILALMPGGVGTLDSEGVSHTNMHGNGTISSTNRRQFTSILLQNEIQIEMSIDQLQKQRAR
jgi:hypothetical protein